MNPATFVLKFRRNLRDYGATIAVYKAALYPFRWVYRRCDYRIYRIDLSAWRPSAPIETSLRYRLISVEERGLIDQIETMEEWLGGQVASKLLAGGICLVALDGDKLAGFNVVGFGRLYLPSVELERTFRPDSAWSEQITVGPDFRGRGIASELRLRMFPILQTRGVRHFYGGTMTDNTASLKLARRTGFREVADIRFRRYLRFRRWRFVRVRVAPSGIRSGAMGREQRAKS